jgi:DNA-binding XRE family transcriptional regulator
MSQAVFARMLNVSTKTMQSWEQGTRNPSEAARRLIQVFSQQPEMFCRIVGLPPIGLTGVAIQKNAAGRRLVVAEPKRRKAF